VAEAQPVERPLHPPDHLGPREPVLLHPERDLVLDRRRDVLRVRVLEDEADRSTQPARPVHHACPAGHLDPPPQLPAEKCGTSR
jgi:hypothetical protein